MLYVHELILFQHGKSTDPETLADSETLVGTCASSFVNFIVMQV